MALLPCLRWGDARWWMPLETTTADALGQWLLDAADLPADAISAQPVVSAQPMAAIHARLTRDPALLIFASLRWLEANPQRAASRVTSAGLARWLGEHWFEIFAVGDATLGAPAAHSDQRQRWGQLRQRFLSTDPSGWMDGAAAWLEVAGPQVPVAWRASWPQVVFGKTDLPERPAPAESAEMGAAAEGGDDYPLAQLSLPMLTRTVDRQRVLQQRFAAQLQREKLAALKQFAYGLSHEINNPLANIASRSQQLVRDEPDAQRAASLQRVVDQAMRAHEMIADVMFFAHPPRPVRQRLCLQALVDKVVDQQRALLADVAIELNGCSTIDPAATAVRGDPAMLSDALRALLRNAAEAIGCGGRIDVSLRRRRSGLMIQVADSGPGLSDQARRHAFDPYYSGREAGRGLGLGLCRVYRVAKLHRGGVSLSSGPAGCVARLWLPTLDRRARQTAPPR